MKNENSVCLNLRYILPEFFILGNTWEITILIQKNISPNSVSYRDSKRIFAKINISEINDCLYDYQFSSVAQLCPTLCDPMNCSTLSLPVHHQLPEFTQTHAHRVSDAIQPSHPLSSPPPPTPNPSQHQGLFQWVNSSQW